MHSRKRETLMIATDMLLAVFASGIVIGMVLALMIGRVIYGWTREVQS